MGPNNDIDLGSPRPLNLVFANQFKWVPNNDFDPGGPDPSI